MEKYKQTKFKQVADLVGKYTGVDVFQNKKIQEVVDARGLYDTIMRSEFKMTYDSIARYYQKRGLKTRNHATIIYSVNNFNEEIRHRRKDLNEYLVSILDTEVTLRQYEGIFNLIMKLKTQKDLQSIQYLAKKLINNEDDTLLADTIEVKDEIKGSNMLANF